MFFHSLSFCDFLRWKGKVSLKPIEHIPPPFNLFLGSLDSLLLSGVELRFMVAVIKGALVRLAALSGSQRWGLQPTNVHSNLSPDYFERQFCDAHDFSMNIHLLFSYYNDFCWSYLNKHTLTTASITNEICKCPHCSRVSCLAHAHTHTHARVCTLTRLQRVIKQLTFDRWM